MVLYSLGLKGVTRKFGGNDASHTAAMASQKPPNTRLYAYISGAFCCLVLLMLLSGNAEAESGLLSILFLVLLVTGISCYVAACLRVGRQRFIGPPTREDMRSLAWPARFLCLSLVAAGLCCGLCGAGSKFGQSETFSGLHDVEAWLGIVSFFTCLIFLGRTAASLKRVLDFRWRNRGDKP